MMNGDEEMLVKSTACEKANCRMQHMYSLFLDSAVNPSITGLPFRDAPFVRPSDMLSAGFTLCVSLKCAVPPRSIAPIPKRHQNMPCHPVPPASAPPITGAVTGAMPLMAPITASIAARSRPV